MKVGFGTNVLMFVIGAGLIVAGCVGEPKQDRKVPKFDPFAASAFPQEYRIGSEDVLEIVVWKNTDLSKSVTVRPDGMITLPLIGEMRAAGQTAEEVRKEIRSRLERYKEIPEVTVTVSDIRSYYLYILGEVKTPGRYQVKSATTLLQGLALAGGFTQWANTDTIIVVRRDQHTKEYHRTVRYKDLVTRGDMKLLPGDTIIVR